MIASTGKCIRELKDMLGTDCTFVNNCLLDFAEIKWRFTDMFT